MKPDTVTQRYSRMSERLGWDMHIHQLRHYSATELICGGVDIRTVEGRLGHSGGGTTTLRVYSAWVAEADQRAASSLAARMPVLPVAASNGDGTPALPAATIDVPYSDSPYRQIAADLRAAMRCGALKPGTELPTVKSLSATYSVSEGTSATPTTSPSSSSSHPEADHPDTRGGGQHRATDGSCCGTPVDLSGAGRG